MLKSIPDTNIACDIIPDFEKLYSCWGQQVHIKSNIEFLKANKRTINFNIIKLKYIKKIISMKSWEDEKKTLGIIKAYFLEH